MSGYTQIELDDIQAKWSLHFPPDLLALYRERRRVIELEEEKFSSLDWIDTSDEQIWASLNWPLEGFWFDVQNNGTWWPEWGMKPTLQHDQYNTLLKVFAEAPKLIPVCGHRYIPEDPCETGNPIFSVYQTDVIIYGANLSDYIRREFHPSEDGSCPQPNTLGVRTIQFWTRAVEHNNERFGAGQGFVFANRGQLPDREP